MTTSRWPIRRMLAAAALAAGSVFAASPAEADTLSAGDSHSCAVTGSGSVRCWGDNTFGQLGVTPGGFSTTPVNVNGLTSGVVAVVAGGHHTCALTSGGGVKCWGQNRLGQLGDGTFTGREMAVDVSGLTSGVAALTAGANYTCALTTSGGVKCWGFNDAAQLGDGTFLTREIPQDVVGLSSGVVVVASGSNATHTCAITTAGAALCWGSNRNGQIGDGSFLSHRRTPTAVSGLSSGVTALAVGFEHTCAITTSGAKCWGSNSVGGLGDGSGRSQRTPVAVSGMSSGALAIGAGQEFSCATIASGVSCWGGNSFGQLGDGSSTHRLTPVAVSGLGAVLQLAVGGHHTCVALSGGSVSCWGRNNSGQIGDGTAVTRHIPTTVVGLNTSVPLTTLTAGDAHTCVVTASGTVKCWGSNVFGQLGTATPSYYMGKPVIVAGLSGVVAVTAGRDHTCVLTSGGGVKCWGRNAAGEVGDGSTAVRATPVDVTGLTSGVVGVTAGERHACALTSAGGVKCWGSFPGDGTSSRLTPVDVIGLTSGVKFIVSGSWAQHTCAVTTRGALKCWGPNDSGQVGDGTNSERLTPVDATAIPDAVASVALGNQHTCAVTTGGAAKCWGGNQFGTLGNGSTSPSLTAVNVTGLTNGAAAIIAGYHYSCASTTAGALKCWGHNGYGQLGAGDFMHPRPTPVDAIGLSGALTAIAAGAQHTCVVMASQTLKCWGSDGGGQLGRGFNGADPVSAPADVIGVNMTHTPPVMTLQPLDQALRAGSVTSITTAAAGHPSPAIQWQSRPRGGAFTDIAGATSSTYSFMSQTTDDQREFRAVFSNPEGVTISATATAHVTWAPIVTTHPGPATVAAGSAVTFSAGATGNPVPAIQWQRSADGVTWIDISGANGASHAMTAAAGDSGKQFRARYANGFGATATSAARLTVTSDLPLTGDLDGDGRTELIVWRPANGTWYWLPSTTGYDSRFGLAKQWGNASLGDVPLVADIDGDGIDDLIVWRASTGTWHWLTSSSGYDYAAQGSWQWGSQSHGDVPLVGDIDGDGKSELIVWRASTGTWYWLTSSTGYVYAAAASRQVGTAVGDSPLGGDLDGDGRLDLTVWGAIGGNWRWLITGSSVSGFVRWGSGTEQDAPFLRDIDGDGKAELVVWRPATGTWFWLSSSSSYSYAFAALRQWGAGSHGDTPLMADVDGDGKADFIVWRPATGSWIWLTSSSGFDYGAFGTRQWGSAASGTAPR